MLEYFGQTLETNANTCLRMLAADPPNVDGARETARRTLRDANRATDVITRSRALFSKKESTSRLCSTIHADLGRHSRLQICKRSCPG